MAPEKNQKNQRLMKKTEKKKDLSDRKDDLKKISRRIQYSFC